LLSRATKIPPNIASLTLASSLRLVSLGILCHATFECSIPHLMRVWPHSPTAPALEHQTSSQHRTPNLQPRTPAPPSPQCRIATRVLNFDSLPPTPHRSLRVPPSLHLTTSCLSLLVLACLLVLAATPPTYASSCGRCTLATEVRCCSTGLSLHRQPVRTLALLRHGFS
jgi:hypothetical protein